MESGLVTLPGVRHPAKYSNELLPVLARALSELPPGAIILDPFGGMSKLKLIQPQVRGRIVTTELEYPWARAGGGDAVADALCLPFPGGAVAAICTSPTYGNRMADSFIDHQPEKGYRRNTYTHALGRKLNPRNSGGLQWGEKYREFHRAAWGECKRVLAPGGLFVLNISDHIRAGRLMEVSQWHVRCLLDSGFKMVRWEKVSTPRNGNGANREQRVKFESVITFRRGG